MPDAAGAEAGGTGLRGWAVRHPVAAYLVLAYAITAALTAPLWLAGLRGAVPRVPAWWHALGALGPVTAALLATWAAGRRAGLARWTRRVFAWRGAERTTAVGAAAPIALAAAGLMAVVLVPHGALQPPVAGARGAAWWRDTLVVSSLAYGLGEEAGWRGFLLPRLRARRGPLGATLRLWPAWLGWHLPFFAYRFAFDAPTLAGFAAGMLAGAVVLTWLTERAGGSVLPAAAFHVTNNVAMAGLGATSPAAVAAMSVLLMLWAVAIAARWARHARAPSHAPGVAGRRVEQRPTAA